MEPSEYRDNSPCVDKLLGVLRNHRRRMIVRLIDQKESLSPRDLANLIAYAENMDIKSLEDVPAESRHAVYVALKQDHIPKLVETKIVAYDEGQSILTGGENLHCATNVLHCVDEVLS